MRGKLITEWRKNFLLRRYISYSNTMWQQKKKEESKFGGYVMKSYVRYMKFYEPILEKRFPSAMKVYRVFSNGMKSFYQDFKTFVKLRLTVLSVTQDKDFSDLSRIELELYEKMPKDMLKIAPVLLLSALPFANYVIFPLAYMYPQKLLTSHFWTDKQKVEFNHAILKERLKFSKPLFKSLQAHAKSIKNDDLFNKWNLILHTMESGLHPTVEQVVECKSLFVTGPYSLRNIPFIHMSHLLKLHGLSLGFHPSRQLDYRAFVLREMDKAIIREGGLKKMNIAELSNACFIRGFHADRLSQEEIKSLLGNWLALSNAVYSDSYSLLLHSPILLGYNLPYH